MGAPPYVPAVDLEQCPSLDGEAERAVRDYWRYYFAGQALQSMTLPGDYSKGSCNAAAVERAVLLADLLIAKLESEAKP